MHYVNLPFTTACSQGLREHGLHTECFRHRSRINESVGVYQVNSSHQHKILSNTITTVSLSSWKLKLSFMWWNLVTAVLYRECTVLRLWEEPKRPGPEIIFPESDYHGKLKVQKDNIKSLYRILLHINVLLWHFGSTSCVYDERKNDVYSVHVFRVHLIYM